MTVAVPEIGLACANLLQLSLPEFIDVAERAGFRRITARPYAFAQALAAGWTEVALQRRLADAGITVTMIDALTHAFPGMRTVSELDAAVRDRLPPEVLDPPDAVTCFRAATVLGASIVNVTHYMGRPLPAGVLADALGDVARRAAALELRISVEFIPDSGLPDLPFAQSVIESCGGENVGLLLDVFHLDRSGGTVDDVRCLPRGAIAGIQLSDRPRSAPGTAHVPLGGRLLPGEGELPLREVVEAALENSPDATVDIEVLNDELRNLPPDDTAARLSTAARAWRATFS
jgi:sugar phosphate isomerase/epimerase